MSERADTVVIVGTGTGVGKTHVSCALLAGASHVGRKCIGLKPIETGFGSELTDAEQLRARGMFHVKQEPPYRFVPPVSPHRAAREARVRIDPEVIRAYVDSARRPGTTVVVETAGGLFSPLGKGITNFDVITALEPCKVVLVAPDRLGVLHDVIATTGLADARGRRADAIVLSSPRQPDGSTGTNAAELGWLGVCEVTAVFPLAEPEAPESRVAAERVWGALAESGWTSSSM